MKNKKIFFIACILQVSTYLLLLTTQSSNDLKFLNKEPLIINNTYTKVLIKGAVEYEGEYLVDKKDDVIDTIINKALVIPNTDIDSLKKNYLNKKIINYSTIFVPFLKTDKLYINYEEVENIKYFLKISDNEALKLFSNRPFNTLLTIQEIVPTIPTQLLKRIVI